MFAIIILAIATIVSASVAILAAHEYARTTRNARITRAWSRAEHRARVMGWDDVARNRAAHAATMGR